MNLPSRDLLQEEVLLKQKTEIKCRTVGSEAGVTTRLEVEDSGDIWADIAYHNTIFKIGRKEILLESSSKNCTCLFKKLVI